MKASGIGGQAVMEGVMMKNGDQYAVAVRKNDEEIVVEKRDHVSLTKRVKFFGLPVIRGVVIFCESLSVGVRTLTYSARIFEEETEDESEKPADAKAKTKEDAVMAGSVVLSVIIAVGLFMMLPYFASRLLSTVIDSEFLLALCEGVIRVTLFIIYIAAISLMRDIKRVFMYHGAEHKTINCVEHGLELTVENVRKQSREHKRCGTSFMLYVMVISVLFFMFIRVDYAWLRIVLRLLLIPVIAGVSYEFIRLAGRTENPVITALSKPGLLLQKLTTREPDDSMIEVAITSVAAVFDWKAFIDTFNDKEPVRRAPLEDAQEVVTEQVESSETASPAAPEVPSEEKKAELKVTAQAGKQRSKKNKHKKHSEETLAPEEGVVANVRVGGVADPIEDIEEDIELIKAEKKAAKAKADAEAKARAEAEAAEIKAKAEKAAEEARNAAVKAEEDSEEVSEKVAEKIEEESQKTIEDSAEKPEEKAEEKSEKSEDKSEEKAEEKSEKSEDKSEEKSEEKHDKSADKSEDKSEEKIEKTGDKQEEKKDSGESDNLGYFRGRRSTEKKNTGLDSVAGPTKGVNHRRPLEVEKRAIPTDDDEDDEVLKKLDRFFVNKNKKD